MNSDKTENDPIFEALDREIQRSRPFPVRPRLTREQLPQRKQRAETQDKSLAAIDQLIDRLDPFGRQI